MAKRIIIEVPDAALLDFESAACRDTGRDNALAALAASFDPGGPYPTLQEAQDALIAARVATANAFLVGLMVESASSHARVMHQRAAQAQAEAAQQQYDAMVAQMGDAARAAASVTVEDVP
jgi:hypothetical protein